MDFLHTFFSVVSAGGASQRLEILASLHAHGHHYPRPAPQVDKIVLSWSSGGELDLRPFKEYGFAADGAGAMRGAVKRWCLAICPHTNMNKWSWKIQMVDLVALLMKKEIQVLCSFAISFCISL